MTTALIHLDPKQKKRLQRRAKLRGKSFSQEVRGAVDLYLDLPVGSEDELKILARMAKESADRSIARLDETIAYIDRARKAMRKPR
jgi:Ribbon-helix-helix protein, copG family